jgi:BirA family biotin operon repressor/biotin-[acetyl-CoA-carboxylase] ligase
MSIDLELISTLCDGNLYPAAVLAARLGIDLQTLQERLQALLSLGLDLQVLPGLGYRLAEPLELLDRDAILRQLNHRSRALLADLEIFFTLASTSDYLRDKAHGQVPSGHACLAEHQRQGRGRLGRQWVSPFGGNIYLSVLWRFTSGLHTLAGLSLAAGIAVVRALQAVGVREVGLKWPNDVVWQNRKLAGILVDIGGEPLGPCYAVVGIGVNVQMPPGVGAAIDQPWTDVRSIRAEAISRNQLAGQLIHHLLLVLEGFHHARLVPFLEEWARLDAIAGKTVSLAWPSGSITGVAQGISSSGELIISHHGIPQAYASGEVSLRLPA